MPIAPWKFVQPICKGMIPTYWDCVIDVQMKRKPFLGAGRSSSNYIDDENYDEDDEDDDYEYSEDDTVSLIDLKKIILHILIFLTDYFRSPRRTMSNEQGELTGIQCHDDPFFAQKSSLCCF